VPSFFSARNSLECEALITNDPFLSKVLGEIEENASICAYCQYGLTGYSRLPHEEKLILALRHPIRENRRLAIQLLVDLRSQVALPVFRFMLETEEDLYVVRGILRSLAMIGTAESEDIIRMLEDHESRLARKAAGDCCEGALRCAETRTQRII